MKQVGIVSLGRKQTTSQTTPDAGNGHVRGKTIILVVLIIVTLITAAYTAISFYAATLLVHADVLSLEESPSSFGLAYRDVAFTSRDDHLSLRGWVIPGIKNDGTLTMERTIIMVHGSVGNRADRTVHMLELAADLAHRGFAVLTFDLRGHGESAASAISLGYQEQRDVLGAVDFLRTGTVAYPELGRPRAIGGWGVSMGAATLLLAAAREPAIKAIVSDCAYADVVSVLQRRIPKDGGLPAFVTPGVLFAAQALYGIDFYAVRPVNVVASIAPRPIFFIHGEADTTIAFSDMEQLAASAKQGKGADVQTWGVPGVEHAQSYIKQGKVYVDRIVEFYTKSLTI